MTARLSGMLRPALALVCLAVFAAARMSARTSRAPVAAGDARRGADSTKGVELASGEFLGWW